MNRHEAIKKITKALNCFFYYEKTNAASADLSVCLKLYWDLQRVPVRSRVKAAVCRSQWLTQIWRFGRQLKNTTPALVVFI